MIMRTMRMMIPADRGVNKMRIAFPFPVRSGMTEFFGIRVSIWLIDHGRSAGFRRD